MGMKSACLTSFLVLVGLGMTSCTTTTNTASSANGILYVTTQGNTSVTAFGINLGNGQLSTASKAAPAGNVPSAVVVTPKADAVFVANSQDGTISSYTVNSDGTLTAANGSATAAGIAPTGLAIDSGGKFLFVANQGTFSDPASGTVSVYSINGSALTLVGSFSTAENGATSGPGPVSVAVTPNADYLYVANQFSNTVAGFSVDSTGALTPLGIPAYTVGTSPSAVELTPDGNFLYVANQGSNNISAFAVCANPSLTCTTPNGSLTAVPNSPFSAGLGPISMAAAADSQGEYLFVADYASNQISQFKVSTGTGALTAQSPATLSTGLNPASVAVRIGPGTALGDGGTTNYVYVANKGAATISAFSYDTTMGTLTLVTGSPATTAGQPSAIAVR
jgi:6-phosphogluconolactonase (cycloisomerase 2 family)